MNQRTTKRGTVAIVGRSLTMLFVFLSAFSAIIILPRQAAAEKKPQPTASPSPQPEVKPVNTPSIPLEEIEPRADELIQKLQEMNDRLLEPTLSSIDQKLKSQGLLIDEKKHELDELMAI